MEYKKLITDTHKHNENVKNKVTELLKNTPIEGANQKITFSNIQVKTPEDSFKNIEHAQDKKQSLTQKVYADATLTSKRTGNILDKKKVYLGGVAYKNKLGTYIVGGSHYVVPHQFRLKPSGYTSIKNNGNVETMFNTAGGQSMKVVSPQAKDDLWMEVGSRKYNTYDVLKLLGSSDDEIKKKIGDSLYLKLKSKSDPKKTYKSLAEVTGVISPDKAMTPEGMKQLRESLEKGKLDSEATQETLGLQADHINKDVITNSIKKVVGVKKGQLEQDDKENLIFKKVVPPEDLISEGITKNLKAEMWKKRAPLNGFMPTKIEKVINEPVLTKANKLFLSTSAISRMPEGYNPLQLQQTNADITPLGEGGVKSSEVITPSMRGLHLSQMGFIDPIKSPEGANTGITLSLTQGSFVDKHNNPAMLVKNLKSNKLEIKTLKDLWKKKIAFPDPDHKGVVGIRQGNKIYEDHIKKADYQIPDSTLMYGPAMNSLGLISSNDPTRNLMASKHVTQSLPLVERDVPAVSLADGHGHSLLKDLAKQHLPVAPTNGTITKIDNKDGTIYVKGEDGKTSKVTYAADKVNMNVKTFLQHSLNVKPGDKVKAGQVLGDSNYTRNGSYALGKNLKTAFMMYPGTRNDAFIVSESAAKKMTSLHLDPIKIDKSKDLEFNKHKFVTMFPDIAKKIDLSKYDENGMPKKGTVFNKGEPLYLGIKKMDQNEIKFANEKVKKLLYGGNAPFMEEWKYSDPAHPDKVVNERGHVNISMIYKSPLKVGDKIGGRSGNKGVVSKIMPDEEMPTQENGEKIEAILGGAGIASRQNPAQVIEATLGEVAKKTGKKYVLPHTTDQDLAQFAKNEAKKHNVQLYHKIYDPVRKVTLKQPVFTGTYHIQKLFKTGETAYSGVGYGATDGMDQPKKGGKTSASSISNMEVNALLSHGAKDFLRETFKIKSQKNRDWFNAFMRGDTMLPVPEDKTSLKKFKALMQQMNMNVEEKDDKVRVAPMTDKDVVKMSNGKITSPYGLKQNSLTPIKGGFYDTKIFGGEGINWGHIDLAEKIVNPNYQEVVARSLGMTKKKLNEEIASGKIGSIESRLKKVNLNKLETDFKKEIKTTKNTNTINQNVKMIKAIKKLKGLNQPLNNVAFISKIPVIPTKFRPVSKMPNGTIVDHDMNNHYAAIVDANNTLQEAKKDLGANHPVVGELRTELQKHVGAMYGTNESPDPTLVKKGVKSAQEIIAGAKPKESLWQQSVLQNKVFSSGRSVIVPTQKYLGMDEVELPKEVAWKVFEPHVKRKMSQVGLDSLTTQRHIEDRDPTAQRFLEQTMKEVPVVINRAPSLHKHNMTGHYAKISPDSSMKISPLVENGQNADYDGDQLGIHVPLTQKAISDVKDKIMASKQLFGARNKDNLQMEIDLDPYVGFYHATKYPNGKKKSIKH